MAEEWGTIIIRSNEKLACSFKNRQLGEAFRELADFSGVDGSFLFPLKSTVDEIAVDSDTVILSYDCSEWVSVSETFISKAVGIEFYAKHADEYGMLNFLALTPDGKRFAVEIDQEGDSMEDEEYQESTLGLLGAWRESIPIDINNKVPGFSDFDPEDIVVL